VGLPVSDVPIEDQVLLFHVDRASGGQAGVSLARWSPVAHIVNRSRPVGPPGPGDARKEPPQAMDVAALSRHPAVDRARANLRERDAETLAAMVELAQIPAPPFGEAARGERVRRWFEEIGLQGVTVDEVGNVLAMLPANGAARTDSDAHRPVLLCAHMDTVFPAGTEVTVRRVGDRLAGPGIADNARGLAALLALAAVLVEARPPLVRPVVFAATVGEEGIGDLRGVKHLFREGSPW